MPFLCVLLLWVSAWCTRTLTSRLWNLPMPSQSMAISRAILLPLSSFLFPGEGLVRSLPDLALRHRRGFPDLKMAYLPTYLLPNPRPPAFRSPVRSDSRVPVFLPFHSLSGKRLVNSLPDLALRQLVRLSRLNLCSHAVQETLVEE